MARRNFQKLVILSITPFTNKIDYANIISSLSQRVLKSNKKGGKDGG